MIDSHAPTLNFFAKYFKTLNYNVATTATLLDAWAALQELLPDLILIDPFMPDGCGFNFCAQARLRTSAPIIFFASQSSFATEERAFALGCDDYIAKPYSPALLAARISALLRRTGATSSGLLEVAPLSVDAKTGLCLLNGKKINLSPMELRLLCFFLENFGRRVHRDTIYENVWGMPALEGSHTVKEHIYRLRKKLGMANPASYFQITSEDGTYTFGKVRH